MALHSCARDRGEDLVRGRQEDFDVIGPASPLLRLERSRSETLGRCREELIGPATVNTMPVATFEAFRDHGQVELTLQEDIDGARRVLDQLAMSGIDMAAITQELEDEGVAAFAKSFRESIQHLNKVGAPR